MGNIPPSLETTKTELARDALELADPKEWMLKPNQEIQFGGGKYLFQSVIGKGGFGLVVKARQLTTGRMVAIKIEEKNTKTCLKESLILLKLQNNDFFPKFWNFFEEKGRSFCVMELLGASLSKHIREHESQCLSTAEVFSLAVKMIEAIEALHKIGIVHSDIKPSNFVFGVGEKKNKLYLIDFGLSRSFMDCYRKHDKEVKSNPKGTWMFMSVNSHKGKSISRRDDMESLLFCLVKMEKRNLLWDNEWRKEDMYRHMKMIILKEGRLWISSLHPSFKAMLEMIRKLGYQDEPNYGGMKDLFKLDGKMMEELETVQPVRDGAREFSFAEHPEFILMDFVVDKTVIEGTSV